LGTFCNSFPFFSRDNIRAGAESSQCRGNRSNKKKKKGLLKRICLKKELVFCNKNSHSGGSTRKVVEGDFKES